MSLRTFLFDCQGTLVGNPNVPDHVWPDILIILHGAGHRVVVWSGCKSSIPAELVDNADECWTKDISTMRKIDDTFVVFDDDNRFLQPLRDRGCTCVHASEMHKWLIENVDTAPRLDPVTNMTRPATREQQAERVRNAYKKLNTLQARAQLKRHLKHRGEVSRIARLYPMHKLYQVHALALHDVTYAGAVGFIMSYLESGNVTFSVFYDRPGHRYTSVSVRAEIEPAWIKELPLEEFEEEVYKRDNPTVLLS